MEYSTGPMVLNITVSGKTIRCMVKENLNGLTGEFTLDNIKMMSKVVMEYILGQMEINMLENSKQANSMEKVSLRK